MPHTLTADYEFLMEDPQEFYAAGRLSTTCLYRTLIALNPECSRAEWLTWAAANGIHSNTAAKQFALSRHLSMQDGEQLRTDGSLVVARGCYPPPL